MCIRDRLRAINVWDEEHPREWKDVVREAKVTGEKYHVGLIFEICVEKNSELPDDDPKKKFKGR
eukprot:11119536-Alexandrium_andersonii.AAC.1